MSEARLPERLTLGEAGATLAALRRALAGQGDAELVIDASALRHFDSSAVAVLLELRREALAQGRTLRVLRWPERLQALVGLYGVQDLLPA
jgi:phospholipid transport system transporter-binding protein